MKRILCGALSALLIFTGIQLPVRAETAGTEETAAVQPEETAATEPVESVPEETQAPETIGPDANERAPQAMTVSDSGIAMLEELEGRGVSSFRTALTQVENSVNSFLSANGLTLTQQQFDALASLQFNCSAVLSGCRVTRLLTGGDYTEVSMANAWCSWVSVGGSYSSKMLERRIRELQVYFYGDYTGNESDPGFRYLVHMPNGGSLEDNRVLCYPRGETYAALQTATRSGMYFAGWYTAASGGAHITNSTPAAENLIVYAHWSSTPVENPNEDNGGSGEDPVTLKTSEACIQFIKDHEGFSKFAYWDYGQWTIGYGTRCEKDEFPDGITEEELMGMVDQAETEGSLDQHESDLIRNAIEFNDMEVSEILTPRVDLEALADTATMEEAAAMYASSGFSRLPIYHDSIDNIIGVLHEKDFYAAYCRGAKRLSELKNSVLYTTETARISDLLRQLQQNKVHMAVVVDEYGGTQGIVTMEDIMEELVGEIWDEHDEVIEEFRKQSDGSYLVACSADLDDLYDLFDMKPSEEYDASSVSGWVMEEIGRVPDVGDRFRADGLEVCVTRVEHRRVMEIRVRRLPKEDAAPEKVHAHSGT